MSVFRLIFGFCSVSLPQGRYIEPLWIEFFFVDSTLQEECTLLCTCASKGDIRWPALRNEDSSSSEGAHNGFSTEHQEMEVA